MAGAGSVDEKQNLKLVALASSVGTMIEWYDFYLYGSLAVFFSSYFYPTGNPTAAMLVSVATFATGFAVRPVGALVFGHLGDKIGRKKTFLFTLVMMGLATTLMGILPSYHTAGLLAPVLLVMLRLCQGLAIGGEYGGAATYVAEHAPSGARGLWTSSIQIMAAGGLVMALVVVLGFRLGLGDEVFKDWGWRLPFLLSAVLVVLSIVIRMRLLESPVFSQLLAEGRTSKAPLSEAFKAPGNLKLMVLIIFGVGAGQAVTFYGGHFYALFFIQSILKVDFVTSSVVMAVAVTLSIPFYVFFGWLSDKIGRKPLMMTGLLGTVLLFYPCYRIMHAAVTPEGVNTLMLGGAVFVQALLVTLIYGPYAAFLVESFPARIRYTSLSIPYHIGNGIFGGFMPLIGLSLVAETGNIYAGIAYPIAVCAIAVVVGGIGLKETRGRDLTL